MKKKELTLEQRMDLCPNVTDYIKTVEGLRKCTENNTFNMTKLLDDLEIPKYV